MKNDNAIQMVKRLVVDLALPNKVITAVIDHQFMSLLQAMKTCNSLEMSGFGKFFFNVRRVAVIMAQLERMKILYKEWMLSDDEQKQRMGKERMERVDRDIEKIKVVLHEHKKSI